MTPEQEQRAAELLPCEHIVDKPGYYNDPAECFACAHRPAVAAALAEKDKESGDLAFHLQTQIEQLQAEAATLREQIERLQVCYEHDHNLAIEQADIVIEANTEVNALREQIDRLKVEREEMKRTYDVALERANRQAQAARVEGLEQFKREVAHRLHWDFNLSNAEIDGMFAEIAALERGKEK